MKKIVFSFILALSLNAIAQIPTNGLICSYPFKGNANDASENKQNGVVNGATLTTDRFGNANSAYYFDGKSHIEIPVTGLLSNEYSHSLWALIDKESQPETGPIILSIGTAAYANPNGGDQLVAILDKYYPLIGKYTKGWAANGYNNGKPAQFVTYGGELKPNEWVHIVVTRSKNAMKLYLNNELVYVDSLDQNIAPIYGNNPKAKIGTRQNNTYFFEGKIDDINLYNRVLSEEEISSLFYQDVCVQKITVTDTLIINRTITSYNPITYENSIKIFPNPTNDYLTVDFGKEYSKMDGYSFKIINSTGTVVYTTSIDSEKKTIDLSSLGTNGIYFVHLIDVNQHTIDIKKIILQ